MEFGAPAFDDGGMPITRMIRAVARPLVKPLLGMCLLAACSLLTLTQVLGVSFDDIRHGRVVPALMAKVMEAAGGSGGVGLDGLAGGESLSQMFDQANLGEPGAIQSMLKKNGALQGESSEGEEEKPRGVVIFSPDGPAGSDGRATPAPSEKGPGGKPAPIIRVYPKEGG